MKCKLCTAATAAPDENTVLFTKIRARCIRLLSLHCSEGELDTKRMFTVVVVVVEDSKKRKK
jgi:hypothetical protein